jgi:hypothetical protein
MQPRRPRFERRLVIPAIDHHLSFGCGYFYRRSRRLEDDRFGEVQALPRLEVDLHAPPGGPLVTAQDACASDDVPPDEGCRRRRSILLNSIDVVLT